MIYYLRSATVAPGKNAPAMAFAREVAEYIKSKMGITVRVGMPVGGRASRIGWFVEFEDLARLDDMQTRLLQDSDYAALLAKASDSFVANTLEDSIWRVFA